MENIQKLIEELNSEGYQVFLDIRRMDTECWRAEVREYSPNDNFWAMSVICDRTGDKYLWVEGDTMAEAVVALDALCKG